MKFGDTYIWYGNPRVGLAAVWFVLGVLAGSLLGLAACAPDQPPADMSRCQPLVKAVTEVGGN